MQDIVELGTLVDDRYELQRDLQRVGLGASFAARDRDGMDVVVRLFPEAKDNAEPFLQRLADRRIGGPNVVPVLEQGVDASTGLPFVATPAIRGRSLAELLEEHSPIEPAAVVRIAIDVAQALADAHRRKLLHGTLTPSEILLEETSDVVVTRVSGLGLFEAIGMGAADSAMMRRYVAPELADGGSSVPGDLWSLGAIIYESLSGKPSEDVPFTHIQKLAPWIDAALAGIVHGVLIRDVESRCPSASELVSTLSDLDMAVDLLTTDMLHTVGEGRRNTVAASAKMPKAWLDVCSTVAGSSAEKLVGVTLNGRFTVTGLVGAGGMGAVYRATTLEGVDCAIKVVRRDGSFRETEARRRFLREARSAQQVKHENVVRVLEAGHDESEDLPYIAMELLVGEDLGHFISEHGPLEPAVAARVFANACRALQAAHELGVIHRDIKPPNLFLHRTEEGTIVPKLCDFGVAKQEISLKEHSSTVLTETGGLLGSPLYMSPEQAENAKQVTKQSDVWSMAISLYEALCGTSPWAGCSTIGEVMLCLYTKEVPPLTDLAPWVDKDLADVVHRGLGRTTNERYPSAAAFADALEPFAEKGPLTSELVRAVDVQGKPPVKIAIDALPGLSSSKVRQANRLRPAFVAGIAVFVLGGLGAGVYFATQTPGAGAAPITPETIASEPSGDEAKPALVEALLRIEPPEAVVTIDGVDAPVEDGGVRVERSPGTTVLVSLAVGDAKHEQSVVVASDGKTMPALVRLELPAPAPTGGKVRGPESGRGKSKPPKTPSTTPTSTAVDPPKAPPGPSATGPKFNTDW